MSHNLLHDFRYHYAEATSILSEAYDGSVSEPQEAILVARAQVHATLALAAATALPDHTRRDLS